MSSPDLGSRVIGNRYRLLARLGQGGMGTVWKAMDDVLNRTVAIKEIDLPESRDGDRDQLRERTMREARAAARLSHPNAVTVYDVVEEAGRPWIVMQLVAAESLADAVRDRGPLPPGRVAEIGLAVLQALQAAHAAGIVHRDVKPGNVLLGYDGRVVLTDFGIATLEGDPSITGTGMLLGAPAYIAPERARGLRPGPASDLWSLGATLYTAVEGRPPYDRETPLATLTALMTEEPPAPVLAGPLTPILQGLLEPDPAHRLDATTAGRLLSEAARTAAATAPLPPIAEPEQPPVAPAVKVADRTQVIPRPEPALEPVLEPATEPAPPGLSPPISPPPRGGPPGTLGKRRRPLLVMLLAAAALVAVAAALLIANLQQPTSPAAKRSAPTKPSPKAAAPSTGPARPPPSAGGSTAAGVPAGYRRYVDPTGFSVAVPIGWQRVRPVGSAGEGKIDFQDPNSSRFLRFGYTTSPKADPVADWRHQEKGLSKKHRDYQHISIEPVSYRGYHAADWDFAIGSTRVKDRGFTTGSRGYAIYLSAAQSQWSDSLPYFQVAADTFQPAA